MKINKILCAKCNKPVDKLEWWTDHYTDDRHIRVTCHGETDEMVLDLSQLSYTELKNLENTQCIAFDKPKLKSQ